jgi:hypothetical protein
MTDKHSAGNIPDHVRPHSSAASTANDRGPVFSTANHDHALAERRPA